MAFKGPQGPNKSETVEDTSGEPTGTASAPVEDKAASGGDKPPKREPRKRGKGAGGSSPSGGGRATTRTPTIPQLQKRLEELFGAAALPFMLAQDYHCAEIVANGSAPLAKAWANLAEQNPNVRRILNNLTQTSAWGEVIIATGSIVIPIAAHHTNFIPDNIFGGGEGEEPIQNTEGSVGTAPFPAPAGNGTATASSDVPPTREAAATQSRVPNGAAVGFPPPPE